VEAPDDEGFIIECIVCLNSFNASRWPHMFPGCGHNACGPCIGTMMDRARGEGGLRCPTCRVMSRGESMDAFPKNFGMMEVLQEATAREEMLRRVMGPGDGGKDGEEPIVVVEGRCAVDPSHPPASVHCLVCNVALCESCSVELHPPPIMSRHKRVALAEAPLLCPLHSNRECDLVCMDPACQAPTEAEPLLPLICERCFAHGNHRGHETRLVGDAAPAQRERAIARLAVLREAAEEMGAAAKVVAETVDALVGPIAEKRGVYICI
jgi:hypothetical protein